MERKPTHVEYICTRCGMKTMRPIGMGRPLPGTCRRAVRPNAPHRWVSNRKV